MKVLAERLPGGLEPRRTRWFRKALQGLGAGGGDLIDAVAKIGMIVDHAGGAATGAASGLSKKAIGAATRKWLAEPSLQLTYARLVAALREQGRRYVVLIDDIDRLTGDEIRDVMRMVKTVGKLPNVVYVLSYDRSAVWRALAVIDPDPRAGAFAEKIVQQELELPVPSRGALLGMLADVVAFVDFDPTATDRRAELVDAGIGRWVRQPRDVVRLANSLRFAWAALRGEIDPDDLLCMEGMRLNDRSLFEWVRDNREHLVERSMNSADDTKATLSEPLRSLLASSRCRATDLMVLLFPNRAGLFRDKPVGVWGEPWAKIMSRRGIATTAGFDAYFSLHPSTTGIPKALVDDAVAAFDSERRLEELLDDAIKRRGARGDTLAGAFLDELRSRLEAGTAPTETLLVALIRRGDAIVRSPWTGDFLGPRLHLHFLVTDILKRWSDEERFAALRRVFYGDAPIASLASLWVDLARASGFMPADGVTRAAFVTRSQLDDLREAVMRRIEAARSGGFLDEQPVYYDIARLWAFSDGPTAPRAWLSAVAEASAPRLARIALGLLGYSRTSAGRHFTLTSPPDELYDPVALLHAAARFADAADVDDDERARILALERGLERLRDGDGGDCEP